MICMRGPKKGEFICAIAALKLGPETAALAKARETPITRLAQSATMAPLGATLRARNARRVMAPPFWNL